MTAGPIVQRILSNQGKTAISYYFVMDWLAEALAVWVPTEFWGPVVGPFIAIISFVCSVGDVPLAAVLWNSGITCGGVIEFIFADLIVLQCWIFTGNVCGMRMAAFSLRFYVSMALAGIGSAIPVSSGGGDSV